MNASNFHTTAYILLAANINSRLGALLARSNPGHIVVLAQF